MSIPTRALLTAPPLKHEIRASLDNRAQERRVSLDRGRYVRQVAKNGVAIVRCDGYNVATYRYVDSLCRRRGRQRVNQTINNGGYDSRIRLLEQQSHERSGFVPWRGWRWLGGRAYHCTSLGSEFDRVKLVGEGTVLYETGNFMSCESSRSIISDHRTVHESKVICTHIVSFL